MSSKSEKFKFPSNQKNSQIQTTQFRSNLPNSMIETVKINNPSSQFLKLRKKKGAKFNNYETCEKFDKIELLCQATMDKYRNRQSIPDLPVFQENLEVKIFAL
jgi:hypothetical protein